MTRLWACANRAQEVLWRQKEQFSDGVGYSWIDGLKEHAEEIVSEQELKHAANRFPENTPRSATCLCDGGAVLRRVCCVFFHRLCRRKSSTQPAASQRTHPGNRCDVL